MMTTGNEIKIYFTQS